VDALHAAVRGAALDLFLALEERWYDRGADAIQVRQFAIQDPDGYALCFSKPLATRRA
jgi:hypothetical protein